MNRIWEQITSEWNKDFLACQHLSSQAAEVGSLLAAVSFKIIHSPRESVKIVARRGSEMVHWRGRLCPISTLPTWDSPGPTLKHHRPVRMRTSVISFGEELLCGAKSQRQYCVVYGLPKQGLSLFSDIFMQHHLLLWELISLLFISKSQISTTARTTQSFHCSPYPSYRKTKSREPVVFLWCLGVGIIVWHIEKMLNCMRVHFCLLWKYSISIYCFPWCSPEIRRIMWSLDIPLDISQPGSFGS